MIDSNFKIVFYNGGFAGDLITALYNPDVFKEFDNKTVLLDEHFQKLKRYDYRQAHSMDEKIEYLKFFVVVQVLKNKINGQILSLIFITNFQLDHVR